MRYVATLLAIFLFFAAIEAGFRFLYKRRYGHPYHVSIKFAWDRMHVVTHPFLSFAYKKNEVIDINQKLPYDLYPDKFFSFKEPLHLNNMGHFGRDFSVLKDKGLFRIACLGDSPTANNIADETRDYSYPVLLEEHLTEKFKGKDQRRVEVYNFGIGGWVSVDIVIDFILHVLPTRPDYVILYHGFTDLHLYLTKDFSLDYSHGRYNLGEVIGRIKRGYHFPKVRFWHSYEWLKDFVIGTGNVRNEVVKMIRKQEPDLSRSYHDLSVEKDFLRIILIVCQYYKIRCILSSYAFYSYDDLPATIKIAEGIRIENRMCKELAEEFGLPFVDMAKIMPQDPRYFLDWVHMTPEGMRLMAEKLGDALVADLFEKKRGREK